MKKLILIFSFILCILNSYTQIIYEWQPNIEPNGWFSSNISVNRLGWQPRAKIVSTSDIMANGSWYTYNNNQNTTYTWETNSHMLKLSPQCIPSTEFNITYDVQYYLENNYDSLYFEYSYNNTNWTTLATYTGGLNTVSVSYIFPFNTDIKFRFRFKSDASINTYGSNIYYADILNFKVKCNIIVLSVDILEFNGHKQSNKLNHIYWNTGIENNHNYFNLLHSYNGTNWTVINTQNALGSNSNYTFTHNTLYKHNYYKLISIDNNGIEREYENILFIFNNENEIIKFVKYYNMMGQEVSPDTKGILLAIDINGNIHKIFR